MKALQIGPWLAGSPNLLLQCKQRRNGLYSPRGERGQQQGCPWKWAEGCFNKYTQKCKEKSPAGRHGSALGDICWSRCSAGADIGEGAVGWATCCPEIVTGHPAHTSTGAPGGPVRVLHMGFPLEMVDAPALWFCIKLLTPGANSERTKGF